MLSVGHHDQTHWALPDRGARAGVVGRHRQPMIFSPSWVGTLPRGSVPGQDPCGGSDPHRPLALCLSSLPVADGSPGRMRIGAGTGQRRTCQVESAGHRRRRNLGQAAASPADRLGSRDRGEAAGTRTRASAVRSAGRINHRLRTVSNQDPCSGAPHQEGAARHGTLHRCHSYGTRVSLHSNRPATPKRPPALAIQSSSSEGSVLGLPP